MNLFEVAAALTLNTKAYKKGLDDAKRETKGFASSVSGSVGGASDSAAKLGQSFVSASRNGSSSVGILQKSVHALGSGVKAVVDGLLKIGEIGVKAFGAVSVAAVGVVKQAVSSYAEYEQLAGGIQKLYGEGAETVLKNAEKAYATAGMSANEYLQNATSFSAMLVNSLAGDEKKAAELTDTAMRDIADNANTFGKFSATELAQVYQALARETYTTLDNLQLGFGGTKSEAQRLIKTANELKRSMGQAGDLTLDKFSDVVEAIHLVQENMNISGLSAEEAAEKVAAGLMTEEQAYQAMGTTAKEATKTISGSLTMTKKAVQDFVSGLANPNADIERLVNNVVTSAGYAAENLIPVIERSLDGVVSSFDKFAPQAEKIALQFGDVLIDAELKIAERLPSMISGLIEIVTSITQTLLSKLADGDTIKRLVEAGRDGLMAFLEGLANGLPQIIDTAFVIVDTLFDSLTNPQNVDRIMDAGVLFVQKLLESIIKNLGKLISNLPKYLTGLSKAFGKGILGLFDGIYAAITGNTSKAERSLKLLHEIETDEWKSAKQNVEEYARVLDGLDEKRRQALSIAMSEQEHTQRLWTELQNLVDANGRIKAGYEDRAAFIANQLSEAYGIEIDIVDGVIKKYDELGATIQSITARKRADTALSLLEEDYQEAVKNRGEARGNYSIAADKYNDVLNKIDELNTVINNAEDAIREAKDQAAKEGIPDNIITPAQEEAERAKKQAEIDIRRYEALLPDLQSAFEEAKNAFDKNSTAIAQYEDAYERMSSGDFSWVDDIYNGIAAAQSENASNIGDGLDGIRDELANLKLDYETYSRLYDETKNEIYKTQLEAIEPRIADLERELNQPNDVKATFDKIGDLIGILEQSFGTLIEHSSEYKDGREKNPSTGDVHLEETAAHTDETAKAAATIQTDLGEYFPTATATAETNKVNLQGVFDRMGSVTASLEAYLPYIPQLAALKVVLDSGALVGALTPMVNAALGAQLGVEQRGGA